MTTSTDGERRKWQHRAGDQYEVVHPRLWMNEHGHGTNYHRTGDKYDRLPHAVAAGFQQAESDDFNVWAFREGKFTAVLWMDEVVDDEADVLASIAADAGLEATP